MRLPKIENTIGYLVFFTILALLDRGTALHSINRFGIEGEMNIFVRILGVPMGFLVSFLVIFSIVLYCLRSQKKNMGYEFFLYYFPILVTLAIFCNITYPTHLNILFVVLYVCTLFAMLPLLILYKLSWGVAFKCGVPLGEEELDEE